MTSRLAAAALAGMVTIALLGGILYGVIFAPFFVANRGSATGVMRSSPDLLWVGLAHIPFGVLLTLIVRWRGELSAKGGALAGALLGLLMAASYDFSQYGTTHLWTLRLTILEPLISMAMVAGAGAVVGMVLGAGAAGSR